MSLRVKFILCKCERKRQKATVNRKKAKDSTVEYRVVCHSGTREGEERKRGKNWWGSVCQFVAKWMRDSDANKQLDKLHKITK